jgi:hypothetical protein
VAEVDHVVQTVPWDWWTNRMLAGPQYTLTASGEWVQ